MPPDLRAAMRTFATGVCVASTYRDTDTGRRHDAVTVNSLGSLSLVPPLVSLSFRRDSAFLADLLANGHWGVSILPAAGRAVAQLLAGPRAERAPHVATMCASPGESTGVLVVAGASWLECRLLDRFELGDHTLVVGEVLATGHDGRSASLVFVHGRYHALAHPHHADTALAGPGLWGEAI